MVQYRSKPKSPLKQTSIKDDHSVGHPVDRHVGQRMRARRQQVGLSQTELGRQIGISFQQIQKYERGANRVSASTLHDIAGILNVSVPFFFEGLPPKNDQIDLSPTAYRRNDFASSNEGKRILDVFVRLPPQLRANILRCLDNLSDVLPRDPS